MRRWGGFEGPEPGRQRRNDHRPGQPGPSPTGQLKREKPQRQRRRPGDAAQDKQGDRQVADETLEDHLPPDGGDVGFDGADLAHDGSPREASGLPVSETVQSPLILQSLRLLGLHGFLKASPGATSARLAG